MICTTCINDRTTKQGIVLTKDLTTPPPPRTQLFCISEVENGVEGDRYATISDIQTSVMTKLKTIPITDFSRAMHQLEDCANPCIAVNGDYFE